MNFVLVHSFGSFMSVFQLVILYLFMLSRYRYTQCEDDRAGHIIKSVLLLKN